MAPKRLEIRAQTGFKSGLKSTLGPLAELLELSWQPGGLLEASWNALGALLEAFGAQKSNWKRLLDGPRPLRRLVSALPGGQIPSKRSPGGSQIEVRKRSKLKMAKPWFLTTAARISMIFEVPGSLLGTKNGSNIGSESHLRRGSLQKVSWSALGGFWSRKKLAWKPLGAVLERFWAMLEPKMARESFLLTFFGYENIIY